MAYVSSSITSSNPGPALYSAIQPALTTAGYTLVDTVVIGLRTHQVWKSPAAGNSAGLDWYLDLGYPTNGTASWFVYQCFEYYDPTTDLGYRGLYSGASSTVLDPTTYSRYGATGHALETNWIGSLTGASNYGVPLAGTSFTYYVSVTANRFAIISSYDGTMLNYCGLYKPDPLYVTKAGSALYPLIGAKIVGSSVTSQGGSTTAVGVTRVPPASSLTGAGWGSSIGISAMAGWLSPVVISSGITEMYPYVMSPDRLYWQSGVPGRGILGDLYDVGSLQSDTTVGNTVTCDGSTWVLTSYSSGYSHALRAI